MGEFIKIDLALLFTIHFHEKFACIIELNTTFIQKAFEKFYHTGDHFGITFRALVFLVNVKYRVIEIQIENENAKFFSIDDFFRFRRHFIAPMGFGHIKSSDEWGAILPHKLKVFVQCLIANFDFTQRNEATKILIIGSK